MAVPAANEVMKSTEVKDSRRKPALKMPQFLTSESLALRELGTEKIRQVLRASLGVHTYVMKDGRIIELFAHFFRERNFPATVRNGARVFPLLIDTS